MRDQKLIDGSPPFFGLSSVNEKDENRENGGQYQDSGEGYLVD